MDQGVLTDYFSTKRSGRTTHAAKRRKVDAVESLQNEKIQTVVRTRTRNGGKVSLRKPTTKSTRKTRAKEQQEVQETIKLRKESEVEKNIVVTSFADDHATVVKEGVKHGGVDSTKNISLKGRKRTFQSSDSEDNSNQDSTIDETSQKSNPRNKKNAGQQKLKSILHELKQRDSGIESTTSETEQAAEIKPPELKINPWISNQAKIVLMSRGQAAVAKSRSLNKPKSEKSAEPEQTENFDLRKSLRDGCSSDELTSNGPGLHQLLKDGKKQIGDALPSSRKIPAHQRFKDLASPTPPSAAPSSLPLPSKYRLLEDKFKSVDTVLGLLKKRHELCTFTKLQNAVQQMTRKKFETKHLAQLKTVYPKAFDVRQEQGLSSNSSDYNLTVELCEDSSAKEKASPLFMSTATVLARRNTFHNNLVDTVRKHHQAFLFRVMPKLKIDHNKITKWHPDFDLENVPEVEQYPLPVAPTMKTCTSVKDVLELANTARVPRMEKALQDTAAKLSEQTSKTTSATEIPQTSNNHSSTPAKTALKGVSQSLINKIRLKEAKKLEECLMRDPEEDRRHAMILRLPEMCRIINSYFVIEGKAAILMEEAVTQLTQSCSSSLAEAQIEEHVRLIAQLVPEWLKIITVRKFPYIKITKSVSLSSINEKLKLKLKY